jgi:hypothetical protein
MQNYGFIRLYFRVADRSAAMQVAMFVTLMGMIIIPQILRGEPHVTLFLFGAILLNHQLAAIGLSSHVWANHSKRSPIWFSGALLIFGSGVAWLILHAPTWTIMVMVGLRVTAGFVHFLYERWIYNLSDPQVRATIGKELVAI